MKFSVNNISTTNGLGDFLRMLVCVVVLTCLSIEFLQIDLGYSNDQLTELTEEFESEKESEEKETEEEEEEESKDFIHNFVGTSHYLVDSITNRPFLTESHCNTFTEIQLPPPEFILSV